MGPQDTYLVVLVATSVVLPHPENKVENGDERPDRVGVSAEHDVAETDVVVGSNVARSDTGEWRLLVEFDVLHDLESQSEVSEKTMDAEQTDDTKVAEHAVERTDTVLADNFTD